MYYLGAVGNPDPVDFICSKTMCIPYKNSSMDLDEWKNSNRVWPNQAKGWHNWFRRVLAAKQSLWDEREIG